MGIDIADADGVLALPDEKLEKRRVSIACDGLAE
jgi:hypothetical protein